MTDRIGAEKIRPDGTSPRVIKPTYKETPYESPARIGNGTTADFPKAQVTASGMRIGIADEPAQSPNDGLIDAVKKVYSAVTQQIAYHEGEAKRLRESLVPFASMARQSAAETPSSGGDVLQQLLSIADKLPQPGEQTS